MRVRGESERCGCGFGVLWRGLFSVILRQNGYILVCDEFVPPFILVCLVEFLPSVNERKTTYGKHVLVVARQRLTCHWLAAVPPC